MWHVDRMRFDTDLCRAVCRRDGVFLYRGKLRNIDRSATNWRLALDQGAELTARYLVDATGRSRALAKRLGARISFHDRLIGLVTMGPANSGSFRVAAMMIQSTPFGWWYAAPIPRGRVVALFTDADLAPPVVRQRLRPVPANSVFTDVPVEAGWLAVGDACVAHDPLCGWGVQRAMSNGILAADAIDDHLRTGRVSSLAAYRDHCRQQFEDYLAGMARHYGMEQRWPGAPFWARRIDGAGAEKWARKMATLQRVQIFPSIGIARIGNSPEWYLGPELPYPAPLRAPPGGTYKDAQCRIKRQAQRFRLWGFFSDNTDRELTLADGDITWTVHLVNAKPTSTAKGSSTAACRALHGAGTTASASPGRSAVFRWRSATPKLTAKAG